MAVEMKEDVRFVEIQPDGKYTIKIRQEQVYDPENVAAMLKGWADKKADYEAWLRDYDKHQALGIKKLNEELSAMRTKIIADLDHLKEGIEMWNNAERTHPARSAGIPEGTPNTN